MNYLDTLDIETIEEAFDWRDIENYEGLYKVNEYGDVLSIGYEKKKLLKPLLSNCGYLRVELYKNGIRKFHSVHRLVATAFCEGAEDFEEVNHVDEDKTNNHYSNLEWCTREYNNNYGTRTEKSSVKVRCVELNMIFNSISEAGRYVKTNSSHISACCRGKRKTTGGYHWEYVEE